MQFGNEHGGHAAAVFFSLVGTCKERGLDPKVYLHDAMLRRAEGADPRTLTPRQWQTRFAVQAADRRSYAQASLAAKIGQ